MSALSPRQLQREQRIQQLFRGGVLQVHTLRAPPQLGDAAATALHSDGCEATVVRLLADAHHLAYKPQPRPRHLQQASEAGSDLGSRWHFLSLQHSEIRVRPPERLQPGVSVCCGTVGQGITCWRYCVRPPGVAGGSPSRRLRGAMPHLPTRGNERCALGGSWR
eukprot:scaffold5320_cov350-Prasinococcus_capsulatus_cf.AAC.5